MSTCLECPAEWLEIEMFRMQTNFIASRWCSSIGTDVSFSRVLKAVLNLRLAKHAHVEEVDCRSLWVAICLVPGLAVGWARQCPHLSFSCA